MKLIESAAVFIPGMQQRINTINKNIENADPETKAIFDAALVQGCDVDGDIVIYKGKQYMVSILAGTCKRII